MKLSVAGIECRGISNDTRTLQPGAAYVALRGESFDGHDFVGAAFERGAAAAVVDHKVDAAGPQLVVDDTLAWLQNTARELRARWGGLVVCVTGSAGKTTTKDAIAAVLATRYRTGKTSGNLNNHIGVPLTLANLDDDCEVAVVETGMNHAGEIRRLASIAQPNIAVVTNVGSAHIEHLGSRDAIAAAKRELVESLGPAGTAVLNADDERVRAMAGACAGKTVFFGSTVFVSEVAHVRAENVEFLEQGSTFDVAGVGSFFCPLAARGGLMAVLAALGVARSLGMELAQLKDAIRSLQPARMRLERLEHGGMVVWNDCYNSNPEAAMMMLELLGATPARRRIAVLGEMLELGAWSETLHREVGRCAAGCGVDLLVGIRGAAAYLVDAAVAAGMRPEAVRYFDDPAEAGRFARTLAEPGDALLFKGSRGTHVELALEAFLN
jgi:UDP-N-acetylmuramoyl-tripeptide--D-alanyl-D-alanine ligase